METERPKARVADPVPDTADAAFAAITQLAATDAGVSVDASASYDAGIGRVDFVLIDLTSDWLANVIDRKDVNLAKPPKQVAESWTSSLPLVPELEYRVTFRVYDRSGVNLVAYDRRDFALSPKTGSCAANSGTSRESDEQS
jgi:hypothetical protein